MIQANHSFSDYLSFLGLRNQHCTFTSSDELTVKRTVALAKL